jgi:hypothetical protein
VGGQIRGMTTVFRINALWRLHRAGVDEARLKQVRRRDIMELIIAMMNEEEAKLAELRGKGSASSGSE